jgi:hypothetical protein
VVGWAGDRFLFSAGTTNASDSALQKHTPVQTPATIVAQPQTSMLASAQSKAVSSPPSFDSKIESPQNESEPLWFAGRYDGNRVIVYFDAVQFGDAPPGKARKITPPVAGGFLEPVELSEEYAAKLNKKPGAEHFAEGDKYDVISDCTAHTITLTKLIGAQSDEAVGNDSYIGALGEFASEDDAREIAFSGKSNYFVLRRHHEIPQAASISRQAQSCAAMVFEPVPFDTQKQIVGLLTQRMEAMVNDSKKRQAERISPLFDVRSFDLADGGKRYYARIEWALGHGPDFKVAYALAAWLTADPSLRILTAESCDSSYEGLDNAVPELLNVADVGGGKAAIIMSVIGSDSSYINLYEYSDGADLKHMRLIQSIGVGE